MKWLILNVRRSQVHILIVHCHLIIIYQIFAKKPCRKACALARVTSSMSLSRKRTLMIAFFNSQFNYYLLIWIYHSHENNKTINRIHEVCLRIICITSLFFFSLFFSSNTFFYLSVLRGFLSFILVLSFLTSYFLEVNVNQHTQDQHSYFNCIHCIIFVWQL